MIHEQVSLAMPSLAGYEAFAALDMAERLGFRSIMGFLGGPRTSHSQGAFPTFGYYDGDEAYRHRVRERLASFARLSIHQSWDQEWRRWLEGAAFLAAEIVTVHAAARRDEENPGAFVQRERDRLVRIGDLAGKRGIPIGVENGGGRAEDYLELLQAVRHEWVGATIDVGHCAYFAEVTGHDDLQARAAALNEVIAHLVSELGDRLFHFHVHNVRAEDWRDHRSAPHGVIDFPRLFGQLRQRGFRGVFDIELEEPDREAAAQETGAYLSELWSRDAPG